MSFKQDVAVGAGAVVGADFLGPKLAPTVMGFVGPFGAHVARYGAAAAGAYAGSFIGGKLTIVGALVRGAIALAAADAVTCYAGISFPVGPIDAARVGAGALGCVVARKVGL